MSNTNSINPQQRKPAHEVTSDFFKANNIQFMINIKPQQVRHLQDGAVLIEKPESILVLAYNDEIEAAKQEQSAQQEQKVKGN